jgi:3-phenylpropionate/trans-cinnamate dioxygenase ferredoxin reductase subunit
MIGSEPHLPYHHPPLSKAFLTENKTSEDILIRPGLAFEKADVGLRLGVTVDAIDRQSKTISLDNGDVLGYDKLCLTVGARPRTIALPTSALSGVFYLRTVADASKIREQVCPGKRAVIIGGGYIGLETAASLRSAGMTVTVLEALPRVLARVTTEEISEFYRRIHAEEGVSIETNAAVEAIEGTNSVEAVTCTDGRSFPADIVVIGIGVVPNTELAKAAGLETGNGIIVDEYARTNDPNIVAAGDCSWYFNPIYQKHVRLESVQNANDQANVAAATVCDKLAPYKALPWFWSDQYDLKLQIAGLSAGFDEVIIRGDISKGRSFAAFYLLNGQLLAVDAVNRPREFMFGKKVIYGNLNVNASEFSNEDIPLEDLIEE